MTKYALAVLCLLVGLVHGLPHLLIPLELPAGEPYTPFAVDGVSAQTFDVSSIYAPEANYTSLRWAPAYDTDVYEYRNIPAVFPYVPFFALAAIARVTGGTAQAFIVSDFFFPALAFFLIWQVIVGCTGSKGLGALAGLTTILVSFGPRDFLRLGAPDYQPQEFSRMLHPELSFTLFLLAIWLLWLAMKRPSMALLLLNGLAGGVLFYVYAYYWPAWLGACALLCVVSVRRLWISLVAAIIVGSGFWLNLLAAEKFPNYVWRMARFGIDHGHVPSIHKIEYTLGSTIVFGIFAAISRGSSTRAVLLFWSALFIAAVCALNEEIVTGFNVESMEHYPNRLFQPFLCLAFFALAGPALRRMVSTKVWQVAISVCAALLSGTATARQTLVSSHTARQHAYPEEQQALFGWLNRNTPMDSVILLPVSDLAQVLPTYTHNYQWIPNGTRTTASNDEILDRFLSGAKLMGYSEEWVRDALAQNTAKAAPPLGITYVYYLFQANWDSPDRRLRDAAVESAVQRFRALDLRQELARFRLDYIYGRGADRPVDIPGYAFRELLHNKFGTVYGVART